MRSEGGQQIPSARHGRPTKNVAGATSIEAERMGAEKDRAARAAAAQGPGSQADRAHASKGHQDDAQAPRSEADERRDRSASPGARAGNGSRAGGRGTTSHDPKAKGGGSADASSAGGAGPQLLGPDETPCWDCYEGGDIPPKFLRKDCTTCGGTGACASVGSKIRAEASAPKSAERLCEECDGDGCMSCNNSGLKAA